MADPTRVYTGWLIDPQARPRLLDAVPPRYPRVVAHHVTLKFGDREAKPPQDTTGQIVGEADDGRGVQALVVRIDGGTERPDGGTWHVTWSLAPGREARESNDVIAQHGWRPIEPAVPLRLIAKPPD
ncbi:MAG: hypothetical protein ACJ798_07430 [Phenylobacterium sp.]